MVESYFANHYSEESFCRKMSDYVAIVGKRGFRDGLILYALILYYTLSDRENVPYWAKGLIIAALGYFIFPLDVIPDVIPVTGYSDDLAIVSSAMSLVGADISSGAKHKANEELQRLFGESPDARDLALDT